MKKVDYVLSIMGFIITYIYIIFQVTCHVHADPVASNLGVFWNDEHEPVVKEGADGNDTDSNDPKGQFTFDVQAGVSRKLI